MIVDDMGEPDAYSTMTCEGCERTWATVFLVERPCPTGDCVQIVCPNPSCRHEWGSWGPVLCKSCGDLNWFWRQHHRIDMWIFDRIQYPLERRWKKWRKRWADRD